MVYLKWNEHEDKLLLLAISKFGLSNWNEVVKILGNKNVAQWKYRYNMLNSKLQTNLKPEKTELPLPNSQANTNGKLVIEDQPIKYHGEDYINRIEEVRRYLENRKSASSLDKCNNIDKKIDSVIIDWLLARGKTDWMLATEDLEYDNSSVLELRWKLLGLGPWQERFYDYEDQKILQFAAKNGTNDWNNADDKLILRNTKQIYYRWKYLEVSGQTNILKNNKRMQKLLSKKIQSIENNSHNNFDRLLDKLNSTQFKKLKDLIDTEKASTVLDPNQKDQLANLSVKKGLILESWSIKKLKKSSTSLPQNQNEQKKYIESPWTVFENQILFLSYKYIGPHWSEISTLFPSRFSKDIKAHFIEVLKTISMKFAKEPLIWIKSSSQINSNKTTGFSYKLRDDQEVLAVWSDAELNDYVPLMFNLLNIDEKKIEKSILDKIQKIKKIIASKTNKLKSSKIERFDLDP